MESGALGLLGQLVQLPVGEEFKLELVCVTTLHRSIMVIIVLLMVQMILKPQVAIQQLA